MTTIRYGSSRAPWRRHVLLALCLMPFAFMSAACRQDMHDQPKYKPLRESSLFTDQRSARPLVAGTVARGYLREDSELYTGKLSDAAVTTAGGSAPVAVPAGNAPAQVPAASYAGFTTTFPFPIDKAGLDRGQERFNIFCSVCHGKLGDGEGMIPKRGYRQPPTYHQDRLRQAPVGYLFDVVTNGFGAMPDYAEQISPEDRWKIIAYIRTLQFSQQGTMADVPPGNTVGVPAQPEGEPKQGEHK